MRTQSDSNRPIYLDYNATTPVDPRVFAAMEPYFRDAFANAASAHPAGQLVNYAVEVARGKVAELLGCSSTEVVFTSGATEANNLALKGVAEAGARSRNRILVGVTEHKAVLDTANWLSGNGVSVELIPCTPSGAIDLSALDELLAGDVALVSVMLANNETGVINPIAEVSEKAHAIGALVHTDATQAAGRLPINVNDLDVDLASISAHKMYGPKGVGALFVRRKVELAAQMHGGGHENGARSGTLNVPGIVGLGEAALLAGAEREESAVHMSALRDDLAALLLDMPKAHDIVAYISRGDKPERLGNTLNVWFEGADADAVVANCPAVAFSSGSACTSRVPSPSHVLMAMLGDPAIASECVRFSLGKATSRDEIVTAVSYVASAVERVRDLCT